MHSRDARTIFTKPLRRRRCARFLAAVAAGLAATGVALLLLYIGKGI